jgi:hypothetical protein
MAGLCELAAGLQTPKSPNSEVKMSIVSGGCLKYSRFRETATGDWVRSALHGRRGAGNDAFVFHQPAVGNSGSPDNFALDLFGSNLEGKHSIALVNGGQSDHQWMDVAQHTGFGHLDSINPVNAHFSAPHGDFLIH